MNSCKNYRLVFVTNLVNHHQIPVADEFYRLLGDRYLYITTENLPQWLKDGGYSECQRPYIKRYGISVKNDKNLQEIIDGADIVIIGGAPKRLVTERQKQNKVTFHYSERWFKDGYYHLLSPRQWKIRYNDYIRFRKKRSYMLCASAFTAKDVKLMFCFPNKCFKWGYFTKVEDFDVEKNLEASQDVSRLRILYVSRFLILKHPEMPVELAKILKEKGYDFEINMYGNGTEFNHIKNLINEYGVQDCVHLKGNLPNEDILKEMRNHQIFLFTSDKNEGWGAVLNEAMSNGCAVVASNEVGAVPFLINDGENGLVFKSKNIKDLISKVEYLFNNPNERLKLSKNAYETMRDIWSPQNAARNFMTLVSSLEEGKSSSPLKFGPCSPAK